MFTKHLKNWKYFAYFLEFFHKGQTLHFVKLRKNIVRIKESFFFVYAAEGQMIISKFLRTFTKCKKGLYKLKMRTCFTFLQIKHENVFNLYKYCVLWTTNPHATILWSLQYFDEFLQNAMSDRNKKYCRRKYAKYFEFFKYFVNIALKNNVGCTFC